MDNIVPDQRKPPGDRGKRFLRLRYLLIRWGLLVVAIVVINIGVSRLLAAYSGPLSAQGEFMLDLTLILLLLLYAVLLAIPFVPGVEIGISLLIMHGALAAPYVYVATVLGLSLSYVLGVAFSGRMSCQFLKTMGLPRACAFVDKIKLLDREERLELLESSLPDWMGSWCLKQRYILLAVLVNLPGNSLIGGGGGIVMVAGLSRLFSTAGLLLTLALATAPVPALVYTFGPEIIR